MLRLRACLVMATLANLSFVCVQPAYAQSIPVPTFKTAAAATNESPQETPPPTVDPVASSTANNSQSTACSNSETDITAASVESKSQLCNGIRNAYTTITDTQSWCEIATRNYLCKKLFDTVKKSKCVSSAKFSRLEQQAINSRASMVKNCTKNNVMPPFAGKNSFWTKTK